MPTLLLTDTPREAARFLGSEEHLRLWQRDPDQCPDRIHWPSLGLGTPIWAANLDERYGSGFWSRILLADRVPRSQFDTLRDISEEEWTFPGPVACLALSGEGFHGQRGRVWATIRGNLHLSVATTPRVVASRFGHGLVQLPAVAAVQAIRRSTNGALGPTIKWVNDIMLENRKIGGVLTASRIDRDRLDRVVFGLGLNVAHTPDVAPTPFASGVDCLEDLGESRPALSDLLWALLETLADAYRSLLESGPEALYRSYLAASCVVGRKVRIYDAEVDLAVPGSRPEPLASGVVRELRPDMTLLLDGRSEPVSGGRLAFEEDCIACGM